MTLLQRDLRINYLGVCLDTAAIVSGQSRVAVAIGELSAAHRFGGSGESPELSRGSERCFAIRLVTAMFGIAGTVVSAVI
jgi:hypothetical protein